MKKPLVYLSFLVLLGACKKNKDDDQQEEGPDPTTARITVYNATQWSTTAPYGTATEGATVSLYATAAAYPGTPAYTGTTNANGEVVLDKLTPGEYFVVAEKEYLHEKISNLLFFVKGLGGFYADSIYQSAPDPQQTPPSPFGTVAGNFRIADLNGDGVIDLKDLGEFPAVKIKITDKQEALQKVLIGHTDNRIFIRRSSAADLNLALTAAYAAVGRWRETAMTLDAVYTDEYDCNLLSAPWCAINTYQVTPADQTVSKFWTDGYLLISGMGSLIANTELSDLSDTEKKMIIGQAKALKAYVYLQLSQYFGSLPLQEWLYLRPGTQRATQEGTEKYIEDLLKEAKTNLQAANLLTDKNKLSVSSCNALLARLYLQQRKFQQAYDVSGSVIGQYSLDNGNNVFTQSNSPEIVWAPASLLFNSDAKRIFNNKGTFSPEIRLAELLLINGEAAVELGLPGDANTRVNALRLRASLSENTSMDLTVLRTAIQDEWKREMAREGFRLRSLVRWNADVTLLGPLGFTASNRYLPIPQKILDWNFNIHQNVGYN